MTLAKLQQLLFPGGGMSPPNLKPDTRTRLLQMLEHELGPNGENAEKAASPELLTAAIAALTEGLGGPVGAGNPVPIRVELPEATRLPAMGLPVSRVGVARTQLVRTAAQPSPDVSLWGVIRRRTEAVAYPSYKRFIDSVLDATDTGPPNRKGDDRVTRAERIKRAAGGLGVESYELLADLTEVFLLSQSGAVPELQYEDDGRPRLKDGRVFVGDGDARGPLGPKDGPRVHTPDHLERMRDIGFTDEMDALEDTFFSRLREVKGGGTLSPWIDIVVENLRLVRRTEEQEDEACVCAGVIPAVTKGPLFIELIWSYWLEEACVPRAMRAIAARFQNKAPVGGNDPLSALELSPLRGVTNLLWGYVQQDYQRLTRERRAFEYQHEYGLSLTGGVTSRHQPADRRSAFIAGFHDLMRMCAEFYLQDDQTTVVSDAYGVLTALKTLHMVLSQGAHNQYGDLPYVSRKEMLAEMYILGLPELREYLGNRPMVPYPEAWMGQIEGVRHLFRWGDQPILHYANLATFGEKLLLSIRHRDWLNVNDPGAAKNWAKYWRPEIQGYIHAYRAVRGVDLGGAPNARLVDGAGIAVQQVRRAAAGGRVFRS